MFMFKPVCNWILKYRKNYQHIKASTCWGMKVLEDFRCECQPYGRPLKRDGLSLHSSIVKAVYISHFVLLDNEESFPKVMVWSVVLLAKYLCSVKVI